MSRQLEQFHEDSQRKQEQAVVRAVYRDLNSSIDGLGAQLTGFSVRLNGGDCLITLRAKFDAGAFIAFVGSETLPLCLIKCVREAQNNKLAWRKDRFAEKKP